MVQAPMYCGVSASRRLLRRARNDSVCCQRRSNPLTAELSASSTDEQERRLFEQFLDALNERGRLPAVDDAMVERGGQVHHLADRDLPAIHNRALGDAVDPDYRDLR